MKTYKETGKVWVWPGESAQWHFVYVSKKTSQAIREAMRGKKRGFGSVRVRVRLGATVWNTSVFPDARSGAYLLPLKASVRRAEEVDAGDTIRFTFSTVRSFS